MSVQALTPPLDITWTRMAFSRDNGSALLAGCSAVMDGLDNVLTRRALVDVCRELSLPLVYGAIAGWYGQVAVQMPGEDLTPLLRPASAEGKGVETVLGNPAFTPGVVASLQVAELAKVLLGRGKPLSKRVLFVNLFDMEFNEIPYE